MGARLFSCVRFTYWTQIKHSDLINCSCKVFNQGAWRVNSWLDLCNWIIAQVQCVSPEEFQNMVWAKASKWEVRCRRLGTAGGRRAACTEESCTGTGSGTAVRTDCCPCYGSHSSQRMCWWPLSWPVGGKKGWGGKCVKWRQELDKLLFSEMTVFYLPWWVFPEMSWLPPSSTCRPGGAEPERK